MPGVEILVFLSKWAREVEFVQSIDMPAPEPCRGRLTGVGVWNVFTTKRVDANCPIWSGSLASLVSQWGRSRSGEWYGGLPPATRRHCRMTRQSRSRARASARAASQVLKVDVGATSHFVAVPQDRAEPPVHEFAAFTADLYRLADWLARAKWRPWLESTGVYWIPLFGVLEERGFGCCTLGARRARAQGGTASLEPFAQLGLESHLITSSICGLDPDREAAAKYRRPVAIIEAIVMSGTRGLAYRTLTIAFAALARRAHLRVKCSALRRVTGFEYLGYRSRGGRWLRGVDDANSRSDPGWGWICSAWVRCGAGHCGSAQGHATVARLIYSLLDRGLALYQ